MITSSPYDYTEEKKGHRAVATLFLECRYNQVPVRWANLGVTFRFLFLLTKLSGQHICVLCFCFGLPLPIVAHIQHKNNQHLRFQFRLNCMPILIFQSASLVMLAGYLLMHTHMDQPLTVNFK